MQQKQIFYFCNASENKTPFVPSKMFYKIIMSYLPLQMKLSIMLLVNNKGESQKKKEFLYMNLKSFF
jgi:hypothetical protein